MSHLQSFVDIRVLSDSEQAQSLGGGIQRPWQDSRLRCSSHRRIQSWCHRLLL